MRVVDRNTATIDYRLRRRRLGLRVWKDRCQIIVLWGSVWTGIGPQFQLPLNVPSSRQDFEISDDGSNVLRVAAFRYALERPGTDLLAVLAHEKIFESALLDA